MQSRRSPRRAWIVVALVFLFMVINFADKAVIGLSSGQIMRELRLTHTQFGMLGSGAAFGAGIVAPLVTWIIERYGWHSAFGVLGLAGLAWAILWMVVGREG